jgi:hypothetical protein
MWNGCFSGPIGNFRNGHQSKACSVAQYQRRLMCTCVSTILTNWDAYGIRNGHQTTTISTTSHQSREMAVSLGPQGILVTGMKTDPITMKLTSETRSVKPASPLPRRNETHLFLRASAFSLLMETLAFNMRLLYLDERARSWGPPVRTINGLLHCLLHCGHVCNGLSEWSPLLTDQCL